MRCVLLLKYQGKERFKSVPHRPDDAKVKKTSVSKRVGANVDLRNPCAFGIELTIGKIRPQHEKSIAALHRPIARSKSEKTRHSNIERLVIFEVLLTAE